MQHIWSFEQRLPCTSLKRSFLGMVRRPPYSRPWWSLALFDAYVSARALKAFDCQFRWVVVYWVRNRIWYWLCQDFGTIRPQWSWWYPFIHGCATCYPFFRSLDSNLWACGILNSIHLHQFLIHGPKKSRLAHIFDDIYSFNDIA